MHNNKNFYLFFLISNLMYSQIPMIENRKLADGNWGTHMPVLITAVMNTSGPILEFGCGDYSTTLLHAICAPTKRFILSLESKKDWLNNFLDLKNEWHHFMYIPLIDENNNEKIEMWDLVPNDRHWSVVFIDHYPGKRRIIDIEKFANNTDIMVVHDTNNPIFFPALSKFKYQYTYKRYARTTTIASNFINVEKLFVNN